MMTQAAIKFFDDGEAGDWIRVEYRVGMHPTTFAEGEFVEFRCSRRNNWMLHLKHVTLIPTADIVDIHVLAHAGCL